VPAKRPIHPPRKHMSASTEPPRIIVFSAELQNSACALLRILAPLRRARCQIEWICTNAVADFQIRTSALMDVDLVIIQRHFPAPSTEHLLRDLLCGPTPVVFDLDDMLLDVPRSHPLRKKLALHVPYIQWLLNSADLVTVSTQALKEALGRHCHTPIKVLPNLIDTDLFSASHLPNNDRFTLLVSGTQTHAEDWSLIEAPLADFMACHEHEVETIFFGGIPDRFIGHPAVRSIGYEPDYLGYVNKLCTLGIDAALVPLANNHFNRCKSNIKWLEYSAAGIIGVYSDIDPYRASIQHGVTGFLTDNAPESWYQTLERLFALRGALKSLAEKSRQTVLASHSISAQALWHAGQLLQLVGRERHPDDSLMSVLRHAPLRLHAQAYRTRRALSSILDRHVRWRLNNS